MEGIYWKPEMWILQIATHNSYPSGAINQVGTSQLHRVPELPTSMHIIITHLKPLLLDIFSQQHIWATKLQKEGCGDWNFTGVIPGISCGQWPGCGGQTNYFLTSVTWVRRLVTDKWKKELMAIGFVVSIKLQYNLYHRISFHSLASFER